MEKQINEINDDYLMKITFSEYGYKFELNDNNTCSCISYVILFSLLLRMIDNYLITEVQWC